MTNAPQRFGKSRRSLRRWTWRTIGAIIGLILGWQAAAWLEGTTPIAGNQTSPPAHTSSE